jgi:hypothetical protein
MLSLFLTFADTELHTYTHFNLPVNINNFFADTVNNNIS